MRGLVLANLLLVACGLIVYCASPAHADEVTVRMQPATPAPGESPSAVLCVIDCAEVAPDGSVFEPTILIDPETGRGYWRGWYYCTPVDPADPLAPLSGPVRFTGDLCVRIVAAEATGAYGWSLASADQKVCRVEPAP